MSSRNNHKPKKSGKELLRLEYADHDTIYMENGTIYRSTGHGWEYHNRFKEGVSIPEAVSRVKARYEARPTEFHQLVDRLTRTIGIRGRWKLYAAITLMPDDADGVWATVTDEEGCGSLDIEDVVACCDLYRRYSAVAAAARKEAAV